MLPNVIRPIVGEHNVNRGRRQLTESENFKFSYRVHAAHRIISVRSDFKMSFLVIVSTINARDTCDANPIDLDNSRIAKIINIWSNPPAVSQLLEMIRSFVVASNEYCQNGCDSFALMISEKRSMSINNPEKMPAINLLIERAHIEIFLRNCHTRQILDIPRRLKVTFKRFE